MIKVFLTGDNHIGLKYNSFPGINDKIIKSRFDALSDMVAQANNEACELFVVSGDMFDNTNKIKKEDIELATKILSGFSGTVAVLPGNHDYYTEDSDVWKKFLAVKGTNTILLNEYKPYKISVGDEDVVLYPAFCDARHSQENKLEWIKNSAIDSKVYNIGVAHGAIEGVTPDKDQMYFLMTEYELNSIPVDIWLIGHTHVQYPRILKTVDEDMSVYKVFNAGSHAQTDYANNTEGCGFVFTLNKVEGKTQIHAHKYISGKVRFYDEKITVSPDNDNSLREAVSAFANNMSGNDIVRLNISGQVKESEYANRSAVYTDVLSKCMHVDIIDNELAQEISVERIKSEFAETSFAAKLLQEFTNDANELQMVYNLIKECKEE